MKRLGFLTPSSNTTLEPITCAMLAGVEGVSAHFSRFRVTEIALSPTALAQFDRAPILAAAELLAHARMDAIVWNGTSSGWLGFEADRELCRAITDHTGIPATTSMLVLNDLLSRLGVRRLGLVTPYLDAVQAAIAANYATLGITCAPERHLRLQDNFSFAEVTGETLTGMISEVAAGGPEAITVVCTNLRAAPLVAGWEAETGLMVLDTIATAVWGGLALAGVDVRQVRGWGRIFEIVP